MRGISRGSGTSSSVPALPLWHAGSEGGAPWAVWGIVPGKTVFIVGVGASPAPPASFPLFAPLRTSICSWLEIDETDKVKGMGPEVFMHCIRLGLGEGPLNQWLAKTLGVADPNAVHAVLARALDVGHRILVIHIDELIARAPAPGEDQNSAVARRMP